MMTEYTERVSLKTLITTALFVSVYANPVIIYEAKAQAVPNNPSEKCRANWFREATSRKQFAFSTRAVDPTNHEMRRINTDLGPNHWYALNGSWDSTNWAVNISSRTEPNEDTRGLPNGIGELFYGVAYFQLEPNTNTIIPISDPGLFEGHAFAAFNSAGEQIARFPTLNASGGGNHYFASFTNNNNTRNQVNDVKVNATWSSNGFVVPVPSDGDVYIHTIMTDELSSSRIGMRYCPEDYSDAPSSYGVARHEYEPNLLLGSLKDVDLSLTGNATASSDDANGRSDEDGISEFSPLTTNTTAYSVNASVTNDGTEDATLFGWIDFDQSGTFDTNEFQSIAVPQGTSNGTVTLSWTGLADLSEGTTFARFRLTTTALANNTPSTLATDGEVEDYVLSITMPVDANLVTVKSLSAGSSASPFIGDVVGFSIVVTNNGSVDATNVSLSDALPAGLTATTNNGRTDDGSGNSVGTYDAGTGLWSIGSLANGATASLLLEGTVDGVDGGTVIRNVTTAAVASEPDPTDTGNDLAEEVTAIARADLSITKTNTPGVNGEVDQASDIVTSGNTTTYAITVTNNGPDSVTGAVVKDVIVNGLTCDAAAAITITGSGIPVGNFTIADLTGAGITLGALEDGESNTISYSCVVN